MTGEIRLDRRVVLGSALALGGLTLAPRSFGGVINDRMTGRSDARPRSLHDQAGRHILCVQHGTERRRCGADPVALVEGSR